MPAQKKSVRQGPIELDYEEQALVIHYEVQLLEVDERGRELEVLETKSEQRRVKIKALEGKDLAQMSLDIIDKCKYIHPSRAGELEQLLVKLRRAAGGGPRGGGDEERRPEAADEARAKERRDRDSAASSHPADVEDEEADIDDVDEQLPPANISEIDDYMDMLYQVSGKGDKEKLDAIRVQIRGTGMILKVPLTRKNKIERNPHLMPTLTPPGSPPPPPFPAALPRRHEPRSAHPELDRHGRPHACAAGGVQALNSPNLQHHAYLPGLQQLPRDARPAG